MWPSLTCQAFPVLGWGPHGDLDMSCPPGSLQSTAGTQSRSQADTATPPTVNLLETFQQGLPGIGMEVGWVLWLTPGAPASDSLSIGHA